MAWALGLDGTGMLLLQRLTNMSADCVVANSLVVAEETVKTGKLAAAQIACCLQRHRPGKVFPTG